MNILSQTLSSLIALAFLGAMGIGGYFAIEYIAALFLSMDMQVAKVTAIALVIVLLATMLVANSIRQAGKRNWTNQLQADKAATYKLFIDTWAHLLRKPSGPVQKSATALPEALQTLDRQLALYGSPVVIKAHAALRALAAESGMQNPEIKAWFAKTLLEVRKDLGSDTQGLTAEALHDLVLPESGEPMVSDMRCGAELRAGMTPDSR